MYNLKVTEKQLEVIQQATELLMRIQLGQWDEIFSHLPIQKDCDRDQLYRHKRYIASILSIYMKDNIDGLSSFFGAGHQELPESNSIALDIHQTLRHYLSWKKAVEKDEVDSFNAKRVGLSMIGVNFDDPIHLSEQPLPVIEKLMDDPETGTA